MPISNAVISRANSHCGAPVQWLRIAAPAVASIGITTTQNHQYSRPMEKPAHRPSARSAYVEKEPVSGWAVAISPSIRITSTTSVPANA